MTDALQRKQNKDDESDNIFIEDPKTKQRHKIKVHDGVILASDWKKIRSGSLQVYDPGFTVTASARSSISFIDGTRGILRYRGYPIETLAEKASFLEVAYLLIFGELPGPSEKDRWERNVMTHTYVHEDLKFHMRTFRYNAHPMGIVISSISALSTFYPEQNPALQGGDQVYRDPRRQIKQIFRILGKLPTIAARAYRHRIGRPYVEPRSDLTYTENFLYMMDCLSDGSFRPHPQLAKALDTLFILHAEHELNCSTAAMRHLVSSGVDVYTALAGAAGALYGPSHGGACEAVLRMLQEIGSVDNISSFLADVKAKKRRLMGFGHRVYHQYDPRAKIVREIADEVFTIVGRDPLIDVAVALERAALSDEYFKKRNLYPNVDFYSGVIYRSMGFPTDMFPVLFMIPRAAGWLAHWVEFLADPHKKIVRPRQVYMGEDERDFPPLERRQDIKRFATYRKSNASRRRLAKL